jgi:hypothetical protein
MRLPKRIGSGSLILIVACWILLTGCVRYRVLNSSDLVIPEVTLGCSPVGDGMACKSRLPAGYVCLSEGLYLDNLKAIMDLEECCERTQGKVDPKGNP